MQQVSSMNERFVNSIQLIYNSIRSVIQLENAKKIFEHLKIWRTLEKFKWLLFYVQQEN